VADGEEKERHHGGDETHFLDLQEVLVDPEEEHIGKNTPQDRIPPPTPFVFAKKTDRAYDEQRREDQAETGDPPDRVKQEEGQSIEGSADDVMEREIQHARQLEGDDSENGVLI